MSLSLTTAINICDHVFRVSRFSCAHSHSRTPSNKQQSPHSGQGGSTCRPPLVLPCPAPKPALPESTSSSGHRGGGELGGARWHALCVWTPLPCFVLSTAYTAPNRCSDFALLMMYMHKWCARRCRYVHVCNHKALFQMTFNFTFIKS